MPVVVKMKGKSNNSYLDKVFYKSATSMTEVPDASVHLIVTSPPYFNIKDYSKDGYQARKHSAKHNGQDSYIGKSLKGWKGGEKALKPGGRSCAVDENDIGRSTMSRMKSWRFSATSNRRDYKELMA